MPRCRIMEAADLAASRADHGGASALIANRTTVGARE
jgi:hypothetical protein